MVPDYDRRMRIRHVISLCLAVILFGLAGCEVQKPIKGPLHTNDLTNRLAKHARIVLPGKTKPPYPTVLFFHGCGGVHTNAMDWARGFTHIGYAAVIVDSLKPRGLADPLTVNKICKGLVLPGSDRAADVLTMIGWARKQSWANKNEIYLAGWSHGGWAVLEFLARDVTKTPLPGTRNVPRSAAADLAAVKGTMLFYPYCGEFSKPAQDGLVSFKPSLMMLAGKDRVVSTPACLKLANDQIQRGWPVLTKVYQNARHSFDVPLKVSGLPNPDFSKAATGKSMKDIVDFLIKVKALQGK